MKTIDSHHHFWHYDPARHDWIDDNMSVIRQDFLPKQLKKVYEQNEIDGCVSIQVDQTEEETYFLLNHAKQNDFIEGVVGWIDLQADNLKERLDYFSHFRLLKGFRHILQGEKPEFMLQPKFQRGISMLGQYNFTYDILIKPHQIEAATTLIEAYPNQNFVVCHLAKPYIKSGKIDKWAKDLKALANNSNVWCKISGIVTEADYRNWKKSDFIPYLDIAIEAFGIDRLMYGSDWPVCLVAAKYDQQLDIVKAYFSTFSESEQEKLFGLNAIQFYGLLSPAGGGKGLEYRKSIT